MVLLNATGNLKRRSERSLRKALQTYFPSWLNLREGQRSDSESILIGCTAPVSAGEVLATSGLHSEKTEAANLSVLQLQST